MFLISAVSVALEHVSPIYLFSLYCLSKFLSQFELSYSYAHTVYLPTWWYWVVMCNLSEALLHYYVLVTSGCQAVTWCPAGVTFNSRLMAAWVAYGSHYYLLPSLGWLPWLM
jgi:hypothetical protein